MADDERTVLSSCESAITTVTLNRPQAKNAIDRPTWRALHDALRAAEADEQTRVVVLTGAGGAFSAGADIGGGERTEHPLREMRGINDVALTLREMSKPTLAKVGGVAVGAGWNLALGCDLVVASTEARFSQIFAHRGLSIDFGGSWLLPRLVGLQQAKRLALLADFVSAQEAHQLGLVTWVTAPDELDGFVTEIAARLAAGPPVALAQSKALLDQGSDRTFREALDNEARAQVVNLATADARAAYRAFADKTEPTFTGEWAAR